MGFIQYIEGDRVHGGQVTLSIVVMHKVRYWCIAVNCIAVRCTAVKCTVVALRCTVDALRCTVVRYCSDVVSAVLVYCGELYCSEVHCS